MKSFSKYISEVAQPRERGAEEEQAFKDQHTYEVIPHPVALDTQFTGDIQKPQAMRPADNKGDHTYDKAYAANVTGFEEFDESVEQMEENRRPGYVAGDDEIGDKPKPTSIKSITTTKRNPFKGKLKPAANRRPGYVAGDDEIGESNNLVDESMMDNIKKKANDMRRNVIGLSQAEKDAAKKKQMAKQHDSTMKNIGGAMSAVAKKDKAAEVARLKQGLKNVQDKKNEEVDLEEDATHSDKHINMAIGIASDKRYKGGNMTGAVKAMNKMKPGISDHPKVAAVLKRQNEALSPKQKEIDHDKDGDIDGKDLAALRAKKKKPLAASYNEELDETTNSALLKPVTTTGVDGKKRTVMKTAKPKITDDNGQDKIITNESILKELAENVKFKVGLMKLKDGKSVVLKKQDADLLTQMFKDLSPNNRKKLGVVAMKDQSGFDEILGFAREAL
tara:strand:+ start:68 stop:1408 length:1341 start_codon:yes stop_codon:yes gene_type:complete